MARPATETSAPGRPVRASKPPPARTVRKGSPSSPPTVSMSMLEPMPPSIMSGVADLDRVAPASRSGDRARKRNCRPLWVEFRMFSLKATGAPLRVTDWNRGPSPRTLTNWPSPTSRSMATPGARCRASARLAAGSSPIRPAVTTSRIRSASRLRRRDSSIRSDRRLITTTGSNSTGASGWTGAGAGTAVARGSLHTRTPWAPMKRWRRSVPRSICSSAARHVIRPRAARVRTVMPGRWTKASSQSATAHSWSRADEASWAGMSKVWTLAVWASAGLAASRVSPAARAAARPGAPRAARAGSDGADEVKRGTCQETVGRNLWSLQRGRDSSAIRPIRRGRGRGRPPSVRP